MNIFILIFVSSQLVILSSSADILLVQLLSSTSHLLFMKPLLDGLSARGHNVTLITYEQPSVSFDPRIKAHLLAPNDSWYQELNQDTFGTYRNRPDIVFWRFQTKIVTETCRALLTQPVVQRMVAGGTKYDLVFAGGFLDLCSVALARTLSDKVIFLQIIALVPPITGKFGFSRPYSYSPHMLSFLKSEMSFLERTWNVILSSFYSLTFQRDSPMDRVISEIYPNAPLLRQAYPEVNLVFLNQDPVISRSMPTMPHAVSIGGIHCRDPKPLSQELESIIASAGHDGIIYFSLGTVVRSGFVSEHLTLSLLAAFSRLNQTVIWKSPHELPNAPKNVKFVSWVPQQDILGHPKTRLFVTQGGMFSLQEAVYHGVPVLGLPIFADQFNNIKRMEELGMGLYLNVFELSEEDLYSAIVRLLYDSSFSEKTKKNSEIFRNEMETPLERAIYWTEYTLRHSNEFELRGASSDVNCFVYFSLDVLAVVLTMGAIMCSIIVWIAKRLCQKSCQRRL